MSNNAFAPKASANSNVADTPFDDDEGILLPPTPVGVLRGHITEVKAIKDPGAKSPKGYMVLVHCSEPAYSNCDDVSIWIAASETNKLRTIAAALGISSEVAGGRVKFDDGNGNRDLAAFKHKPGMFVYAPYKGSASIARFGLPKTGSSPEWDEYAEQAQFTDEQIKALKRADCGIVPGDKIDLFS